MNKINNENHEIVNNENYEVLLFDNAINNNDVETLIFLFDKGYKYDIEINNIKNIKSYEIFKLLIDKINKSMIQKFIMKYLKINGLNSDYIVFENTKNQYEKIISINEILNYGIKNKKHTIEDELLLFFISNKMSKYVCEFLDDNFIINDDIYLNLIKYHDDVYDKYIFTRKNKNNHLITLFASKFNDKLFFKLINYDYKIHNDCILYICKSKNINNIKILINEISESHFIFYKRIKQKYKNLLCHYFTRDSEIRHMCQVPKCLQDWAGTEFFGQDLFEQRVLTHYYDHILVYLLSNVNKYNIDLYYEMFLFYKHYLEYKKSFVDDILYVILNKKNKRIIDNAIAFLMVMNNIFLYMNNDNVSNNFGILLNKLNSHYKWNENYIVDNFHNELQLNDHHKSYETFIAKDVRDKFNKNDFIEKITNDFEFYSSHLSNKNQCEICNCIILQYTQTLNNLPNKKKLDEEYKM